MKAGDRVRWSGHVIKTKRDFWNAQGREPQKSAARQWLDEAIAARGTVLEVKAGRFSPEIVCVKMDGETAIHESMSYLFEVVEAETRKEG